MKSPFLCQVLNLQPCESNLLDLQWDLPYRFFGHFHSSIEQRISLLHRLVDTLHNQEFESLGFGSGLFSPHFFSLLCSLREVQLYWFPCKI